MVSEKKVITEDDKELIAQWYARAKTCETPNDAAHFAEELMDWYGHDYGTIVHALAAGAIAMSTAMNKHKQGGITGFQAGAVMWEFIRHWIFNDKDVPLHLIDYSKMLYPQYQYEFEKTIHKETHEWLIKEAQKKLKSGSGSVDPKVKEHWEKIAGGKIPFGYEIDEAE